MWEEELMAVLDLKEIKENTICWGFAYNTSNTEKTMSTRCKPVKGMIMAHAYCNGTFDYRHSTFHELKKNGEPKSTSVRAWSRGYADCEKDAIIEYNSRVEYQIQFLLNLVEKALEDKIEVETIKNTK